MLEEALRERGFEEREFRYLKVRNAMGNFAVEVKELPTRLAVRNLLPIASLAGAQVEADAGAAVRRPRARPAGSWPGRWIRVPHPDALGQINVQVKLSNEPGCARVESPELFVSLEGPGEGIQVLANTTTAVPTVRGGESRSR